MNTKRVVKEHYSKLARTGSSCCSCGNKEQIAKEIGYSKEEIEAVPEANLGLGCGNPTAMALLRKGDVVVDLGSGAGMDCFIAARKVGSTGKVVGIDFSRDMLKRARANAKKISYSNVEFKYGDIEKLPLPDSSADVIISNCVINLAPHKEKVFGEAFRVLRKGGRMYVSDIVLLGKLTPTQKKSKELLAGCVSGALPKEEYIMIAENAGFKVRIMSENKEISKTQYQGIPLESLKIEAIK